MFSHERLVVYQQSLRFAAGAELLIERWERHPAFVDHLSRAAESIVVNLAEACRLGNLSARQMAADYSLGSVLECAACFDVAEVMAMLGREVTAEHKMLLLGICKGLISLRRSWDRSSVRDAGSDYATAGALIKTGFHHETLDVYRVALDIVKSLTLSEFTVDVPARMVRAMDEASTSIVLNVAEGNGRFCRLDHERFMSIANRSVIRLAALLDVGTIRDLWGDGVAEVKKLLERAANMTAVMSGAANTHA